MLLPPIIGWNRTSEDCVRMEGDWVGESCAGNLFFTLTHYVRTNYVRSYSGVGLCTVLG
jgi:hypothetical protein